MRYSGMTITLSPQGIRVKQVSKAKARKLYDEGKTIYFNSCNLTLNNPWTAPCPVNKIIDSYGVPFEQILNEFMYYNCDSERGKYVNFFVEV